MFNLIKKDLIVQKNSWFFLLIYGLFCVFVLNDNMMNDYSAAIILMPTIVVIFNFTVWAYDEKVKFYYITNSLPVTRKEFVLSKYLITFIYVGFAIIYILGLGVLNNIVFGIKLKNIINLTSFIIGLVNIIIIMSITIPVNMKFDTRKGRVFNFLIMIVLITVFNIVQEVFQRSDIVFLQGLRNSNIFSYSSLFIIGILIMYISYIISLKIYRNKEF